MLAILSVIVCAIINSVMSFVVIVVIVVFGSFTLYSTVSLFLPICCQMCMCMNVVVCLFTVYPSAWLVLLCAYVYISLCHNAINAHGNGYILCQYGARCQNSTKQDGDEERDTVIRQRQRWQLCCVCVCVCVQWRKVFV